jgi:hypothetical protein
MNEVVMAVSLSASSSLRLSERGGSRHAFGMFQGRLMSGEDVAFAAQPHAIDEMASNALAAPAAHVSVDAYLLTPARGLALCFIRHYFASRSAAAAAMPSGCHSRRADAPSAT